MRAWLYYRLSRDEDKELNSLTNQKNILVEYAENNGYTVIGESFDDNVSGMHFNREGIEKIYDEVEKKTIDAVIVKDLSRLGRHKTQTALFIDYLREHDVRVLSVTENIDTSNEDDELMVGFKGIFNDMYCWDISKKIRAGYKQKQKQGIVLIPPMGYFKDKNTGEVVIIEEQAAIVRRIFDLYLSGYGIKAIAKILNAEDINSQGYYQQKHLGKKLGYNKPEIAHRFLWENTGIKRVLQNEYAGRGVHEGYGIARVAERRASALFNVTHDGYGRFISAVRSHGNCRNNAERKVPLHFYEQNYRGDKRDIKHEQQPRRHRTQSVCICGFVAACFSVRYRACCQTYSYCRQQKVVHRHANRKQIVLTYSQNGVICAEHERGYDGKRSVREKSFDFPIHFFLSGACGRQSVIIDMTSSVPSRQPSFTHVSIIVSVPRI